MESIPLQTIHRVVKQKPKYVLGIVGCFESEFGDIGLEKYTAFWSNFLPALASRIRTSWGIEPQIVLSETLTDCLDRRSSGKARHNRIEEVARWRAQDLCLVDLSYNHLETLQQFGRHCDGVVMLVYGRIDRAKRMLRAVKNDAIPWIGYWTMESASGVPQHTTVVAA